MQQASEPCRQVCWSSSPCRHRECVLPKRRVLLPSSHLTCRLLSEQRPNAPDVLQYLLEGEVGDGHVMLIDTTDRAAGVDTRTIFTPRTSSWLAVSSKDPPTTFPIHCRRSSSLVNCSKRVFSKHHHQHHHHHQQPKAVLRSTAVDSNLIDLKRHITSVS